MNSMSVVSLKNIRKTYSDHVAVDNFSLDLRQGEIVCLLGPSGCGKTTTLRMVAGFVKPSAGQVLISDNDVTNAPSYRRNTGMVFQAYGLFPHMTVEQNIAFGLDNQKMRKKDKRQRVAEMLQLVELQALAHRYPKALSGGQQQRVALARALAVRPDVLLLDEPFSNLDAQLRNRLRSDMRQLIKRVNITTLFVTHDQEEALSVADRIVVMSKGVVEQVGTPWEIYGAPKTQFVAEFIGSCNLVSAYVDNSRLHLSTEISLPFEKPRGNVTAVIRPETIKLCEASYSENCFAAEVLESVYLGHTYRLKIKVGDLELLMNSHVGTEKIYDSGTRIFIAFDSERITFLPAA
ncbi:ABC transporter ATP-binding protein [Klebsiella sp. 2680]|uniref:ABC transporter ATP-binding protein n=1 Tax=Klebsiella sp. 2680 TaxID=2018037 RepID=UPI00115A492D|nr:ABC transporter ATP-binding protein [Klebsiella sp. 2680]